MTLYCGEPVLTTGIPEYTPAVTKIDYCDFDG